MNAGFIRLGADVGLRLSRKDECLAKVRVLASIRLDERVASLSVFVCSLSALLSGFCIVVLCPICSPFRFLHSISKARVRIEVQKEECPRCLATCNHRPLAEGLARVQVWPSRCLLRWMHRDFYLEIVSVS